MKDHILDILTYSIIYIFLLVTFEIFNYDINIFEIISLIILIGIRINQIDEDEK